MRDLIQIDNHTLDRSLFEHRMMVLDVGSRDYRFSREILEYGAKVYAVDPDPTVENPPYGMIHLIRAALVAEKAPKHQNLVMTKDPEARYLICLDRATQWPQVPIRTITLAILQELCPWFDIIKLNCEGSEFDLLDELERPIATQISVSFHEHCQPRGKDKIDQLIQKLSEWYEPARHVFEPRHCAGLNFWDTLLVWRGNV